MKIFSTNINFCGKYIIRGDKSANNQLYKNIKEENSKAKIPTVKVNLKNGNILVLTEEDVSNKKNPLYLSKINRTVGTFVNSRHILDTNSGKIKAELTKFDTINGIYQRVTPIKINNIKFFPYFENTNSIYEKRMKSKCEFQTELPIEEAVKTVYNSYYTRYEKTESNRSFFYVFANEGKRKNIIDTIQNNPKLNKLKSKGLIGAGSYNMVFDIGDNKTLKISDNTCYPRKVESFDLPIIDKGYDKKNKIYWCICPKGQNETDSRIKIYEITKRLKEMERKGYKLEIDINNCSAEQFVRFDNKIYLVDYDCISYKDGSSRMKYY